MSLQTRLESLVTSIGADVKSLRTRIGFFEAPFTTNTLDGGETPDAPYDGEQIHVDGGASPDAPYSGIHFYGMGEPGPPGDPAANLVESVNGRQGVVVGLVETTDGRLSNARTPTAHASQHASNGTDPVTPASIGAVGVAQINAANGVAGLNSSGVLTNATLTASRALATDGSKGVVSSATTAAELAFLNGVTSSVQTQLNAKAKIWEGGLDSTPIIVSPESPHASVIPYYMNDIAYNRFRGGAARIYYDGVHQVNFDQTQLDKLFDPTSDALSINITGITTVIIEIDLCTTFNYGTKIGYAVNEAWRAKDVTVEVYKVSSGAWHLVGTVLDVAYGEKVFSYSGDANPISKVRFTFSDFAMPPAQYTFRMGQLYVLPYNSALGQGPFVSRGGGDIYGSLSLKGARFNLSAPTIPATATSVGVKGDISYDANYIYVCVATNSWKRTPLAAW